MNTTKQNITLRKIERLHLLTNKTDYIIYIYIYIIHPDNKALNIRQQKLRIYAV